MVCTGNPYCTIIAEFISAKRKPFFIEKLYLLRRFGFIPTSFINADHFAGLATYATITKEVWRVGKYHVKSEIEPL